MEFFFTLIPSAYRAYAARTILPVLVAIGFIQIEGVIIYLADGASLIGLVVIFSSITVYRVLYVQTWVKVERWMLVHDRHFLFNFRFLRLKVGRGVRKLFKWTWRITSRRNSSVWRVGFECLLVYVFALSGLGLKFGIGMIIVSKRPKVLMVAAILGLMTNTYVFLHWGPNWWQEFRTWAVGMFRGLF